MDRLLVGGGDRMSGPKSGPARMATRQARFREEIDQRFEELRQALELTIVQNNAMGITNASPVDSFPFETPEENLSEFVDWWNGAVDEGLLEPTSLDRVTAGRHWTSQHIDSAYADGIEWGDSQLEKAGEIPEQFGTAASVRLPAHQEALRTVRTRAYSNLENISTDMEEDIAEILTDGVRSGDGAIDVGRRLSREVDTFSSTRGAVLARTEIMNAHSNATAHQYEQFGVEYADVLTSQPCPICAGYADEGPYPIKELRAKMPFHPNCVCVMIPAEAPKQEVTQETINRGVRESNIVGMDENNIVESFQRDGHGIAITDDDAWEYGGLWSADDPVIMVHQNLWNSLDAPARDYLLRHEIYERRRAVAQYGDGIGRTVGQTQAVKAHHAKVNADLLEEMGDGPLKSYARATRDKLVRDGESEAKAIEQAIYRISGSGLEEGDVF